MEDILEPPDGWKDWKEASLANKGNFSCKLCEAPGESLGIFFCKLCEEGFRNFSSLNELVKLKHELKTESVPYNFLEFSAEE